MKHSPGNKHSLGLSPALLLETRSKHSGRWRRGKGESACNTIAVLFCFVRHSDSPRSKASSERNVRRQHFVICYLLFSDRLVSFPPSLLPRSTLSQDEPISPRNCILPPSLALKVRNDTTLLVRRARYRTKLGCFLVCHDYTNI